MINTNANEIKKIIVNCDKLPKNKAGKNDRLAILKGLEHGHTYNLTVTFIYNDWNEYETTFTITRLLQNREWVNVKDTGEGRFGGFSLLFNSLLAGTFKKEAQEQSDRYYNLVKSFNEDKQRAVDNERQKTFNAQYKNGKLQKENEELKNQIVVLGEANTTLTNDNKILNNDLHELKNVVKISERKSKIIDEFLNNDEFLSEFAKALSFKSQEKRVELLKEFLKQLK